MPEVDLKALLRRDPKVEHLLQIWEKPSFRLNLFGLNGSARTYLYQVLLTERAALIVVADELKARELRDAYLALGLEAPALIRALGLNLDHAEAASREQSLERQSLLARLLAGERFPLILTASALADRVAGPQRLRQFSLQLRQGQRYDLTALCDRLCAMGYERCRQVETAGQFALRGELLDLGLSAPRQERDCGLRLSFFDDELEQLRSFDLDSQRSTELLEEALVPPAAELLLTADEQKAALSRLNAAGEEAVREARRQAVDPKRIERLAEAYRQARTALEEDPQSPGLERFRDLLLPDDGDYLQIAAELGLPVLLEDLAHVSKRLDAADADFHLRLKEQVEQAVLPPELLALRRSRSEVFARLAEMPRLVALGQLAASTQGFPQAETLQFQIQDGESFRGREKKLIPVLSSFRAEHYTIQLVAGSEARQKRLRELLNEGSLTLPILVQGPQQGFIWPAARLAVCGSVDLFGQERKQFRSSRGKRALIDFSADLKPGDLVVHEVHGIARYDGIVSMKTSGAARDYLKLSYAGEDALFLPVESIDRIQRYIGSEGKKPQLTRLGGQDWERLKAKARDSIRKLAVQLLAVYAERRRLKGLVMAADNSWQEEFEAAFPYVETEAQLRAIQEIKADQMSDKVMDRLLCGDVGFGKTEIAFRALVKAVLSGYQALLMAPTTVLAKQHYEGLRQRLGELPLRVRLLSRYSSETERKAILTEAERGELDILIGTHSLLSKALTLAKPGLLVVDEEQRFGVDHKELIKARYPELDVLTLSATPIPRTLHMSMSGIRDISVLEEGPSDRLPVRTFVIEQDDELLAEAMLREIGRQGQVYYLYNDTRRLAEKANQLAERLPGARIVTAHGKMSERRLDEAMSDFAEGQYDILVCTTIIESGLDIPNVNTIIVENANRLGLAQLYQIRGRVGRSGRQAYAYMTYRPETVLTEEAEQRLAAIRDYTALGSGFRIALRDLEVRGAGNLLGAEQHGHMEAIGYEMYCRILDEEMAKLDPQSEQAPRVAADCVLDLTLDALLPESYIPNDGERMDMYRRLSRLHHADDYDDILDEWLDRFGDPPEAALRLLNLAYVRARAATLGFTRIRIRGRDLFCPLKEIRPEQMTAILALLANEKFKGRLLFNGGQHPYLLILDAAEPITESPKLLYQLFRQGEEALKKAKCTEIKA